MIHRAIPSGMPAGLMKKQNLEEALGPSQEVIDEIGLEGARKWKRDVKQQKYMKLWMKIDK